MQQSKIKNGTITNAKKGVPLLIDGQSIVGIQITGTFVATLAFEGSLDGTNWVSLFFKTPSGDEASSATAAGIFTGSVAGLKHVRVKASAYTSGSAVITIITSMSGAVSINQTDNAVATASGGSPKAGKTALAANAARKGWLIQNLGQNDLFVKLGAGASLVNFHIVLVGGSADDDGLGGSFSQFNGAIFTGIISIKGTAPRYVVTEL